MIFPVKEHVKDSSRGVQLWNQLHMGSPSPSPSLPRSLDGKTNTGMGARMHSSMMIVYHR